MENKAKAFEAKLNSDGSIDISDGYHTFTELYEHRCLLFAMLCSSNDFTRIAWKSKRHSDGTGWPGWFIAGINLPTGIITYHLPDSLWDLVFTKELEKAPEWDGHTSSDVILRIKEWLR